MEKKNGTDRTTRLLITLTLLGGTWYIFRGVINLWIKTFSEVAYTESIINVEHILSMWLLVVMVFITGTVIRYILIEYKSYQHLPNNEDRENSISDADNAFKDIYKILNLLTTLSIFVLILAFFPIFFTQIKLKSFILLIGVGLIIGLIYLFIFEGKLKSQFRKINTKLTKLLNISSSQSKLIGLFLYLCFLVVMTSFYILVFSIEGNQEVTMKINDTKKVPVEIVLDNFEKPTVEINIIRKIKTASNVKIELEEYDLQKSFIEVYESSLSKGNFLLKESEDKNKKVPISKNKYYYKYDLELEEYLLEGENLVEVYILNKGNLSKKTVHIGTSIYKEGDKIKISRKNFKINP